MISEFRLPDVGEGISEAEIVRWLVAEGATVKEDQDIVEIETDKAIVALPSPHSGKIVKLHRKPGDLTKVGEILVSIETEDSGHERPQADHGTVVGSLGQEAVIELPTRVKATPAVRALGKRLGIDLAKIRGTGSEGKITREDIERAAAGTAAEERYDGDSSGPVERIPLRGLRRTIAKRMHAARQRVSDVTIWEDADITALDGIRSKEKTIAAQKGIKLTYLPYVIQATIDALKAHPYLNASLEDEREEILLKKFYNIGIAVDTVDGLMVFAIKRADQKSLLELAQEISTLAEKARTRKLDLSELRGSTFTITNYGVIGATYGTPIINYPEVGILGIGRIQDRPVVDDGDIAIHKIMPLSLVFDHRVVDGVEAARFLNVIIDRLEDPKPTLVGAVA
ncbi:MAG TPA: dihydrolipoamide acetyltransferase family protein [Candidatus Binatia bacterium]